jgi:hypothetical protein
MFTFDEGALLSLTWNIQLSPASDVDKLPTFPTFVTIWAETTITDIIKCHGEGHVVATSDDVPVHPGEWRELKKRRKEKKNNGIRWMNRNEQLPDAMASDLEEVMTYVQTPARSSFYPFPFFFVEPTQHEGQFFLKFNWSLNSDPRSYRKKESLFRLTSSFFFELRATPCTCLRSEREGLPLKV